MVVEQVPASTALDQRARARAPRFKMVDGIETEIDGNPATLVDLSVSRGAGRVADHPEAESARPHLDAAPPSRLRFNAASRGRRSRFRRAIALPRRHRVLRRRRGAAPASSSTGTRSSRLGHLLKPASRRRVVLTIVSLRSEPVETIGAFDAAHLFESLDVALRLDRQRSSSSRPAWLSPTGHRLVHRLGVRERREDPRGTPSACPATSGSRCRCARQAGRPARRAW